MNPKSLQFTKNYHLDEEYHYETGSSLMVQKEGKFCYYTNLERRKDQIFMNKIKVKDAEIVSNNNQYLFLIMNYLNKLFSWK